MNGPGASKRQDSTEAETDPVMTAQPNQDDNVRETQPVGRPGDGVPRAPDGTRLPERWEIRSSTPKLLFLTLPCVVAVAISLQADGASRFEAAEFTWVRVAGIVIALAVALQVARMAFERDPVVVLDSEGIHCRRPPIGLINWTAITALGSGKATLMRRVLLIAADPARLSPEARTFASRSSGFNALISPQLTRFGQQTRGSVNFHIAIGLLEYSPRRIEGLVQAYGFAHIPDE